MKLCLIFILLCVFINNILLTSCKKELDEPNWDVDVFVPLAKATLTVNNIYNDTSKRVNPDNSISMVYSTGLYSYTLDTVFKIPDTTISYTAKLSSINLGIIDITNRTSLGDIAIKDKETNGPNSSLYQSIMTAHNTGTPTVLESISEQVFDSLSIDAGQYFQTATLSSGFMDIKIDNQLPIPLTNIVFQVRNRSNNMLVIQDTFLVIPSHSYLQKTKSLAGITIEGLMYGFVKISSPSSGTAVTMDTSQSLTTQIIIRDVKVTSAIANFPGQNLIEQKEKTYFKSGEAQLCKAIARSGNIQIDVFNTLHENLHFSFKIYSATKNGIPLEINCTIPHASGSTASYTSINKNIEGYEINLKGIGPVEQIYGDLDGNGIINADTINTIYSVLTGSIDSSGNPIHLSLQDSIYFRCSFFNLKPEYLQGFLGKDTLVESGSIQQDVLTQLTGSSLNFNDVKLSLNFVSQFGAAGQVKIEKLKATNTSNNKSALLSVSNNVNPFSISRPVNPYSSIIDVIPSYNILQLNSSNSNISDLINVIPNTFEYSVQIFLNAQTPEPALGGGTDFVYYGDKISASLDIEIPLSVIANNVKLTDTTAFSFGKTKTDQITGGNLIIITENEFPIEISPQVFLLDSLNKILESILPANSIVAAADTLKNTGRVAIAKKSKIIIPVTPARLELLKKTKKIRSTALFVTQPQSKHVKIYNDYTMKFKLVGDFTYKLH